MNVSLLLKELIFYFYLQSDVLIIALVLYIDRISLNRLNTTFWVKKPPCEKTMKRFPGVPQSNRPGGRNTSGVADPWTILIRLVMDHYRPSQPQSGANCTGDFIGI